MYTTNATMTATTARMIAKTPQRRPRLVAIATMPCTMPQRPKSVADPHEDAADGELAAVRGVHQRVLELPLELLLVGRARGAAALHEVADDAGGAERRAEDRPTDDAEDECDDRGDEGDAADGRLLRDGFVVLLPRGAAGRRRGRPVLLLVVLRLVLLAAPRGGVRLLALLLPVLAALLLLAVLLPVLVTLLLAVLLALLALLRPYCCCSPYCGVESGVMRSP